MWFDLLWLRTVEFQRRTKFVPPSASVTMLAVPADASKREEMPKAGSGSLFERAETEGSAPPTNSTEPPSTRIAPLPETWRARSVPPPVFTKTPLRVSMVRTSAVSPAGTSKEADAVPESVPATQWRRPSAPLHLAMR